jgi:hypothetical protein
VVEESRYFPNFKASVPVHHTLGKSLASCGYRSRNSHTTIHPQAYRIDCSSELRCHADRPRHTPQSWMRDCSGRTEYDDAVVQNVPSKPVLYFPGLLRRDVFRFRAHQWKSDRTVTREWFRKYLVCLVGQVQRLVAPWSFRLFVRFWMYLL